MVAIREAYRERERKRFMRRDAHRYWRPDAERWMTAEERRLLTPRDACSATEAIERKANLHGVAEAAAIEAECRELCRLKRVVGDLKFDLALLRFARKYRPDQPRDDHGRWVYDGGRRPRQRISEPARVRLADASDVLGSPVMSDASPDPIIPGAQYAAIEIAIQPGVLGHDPQVDRTTLKLTGIVTSIADAVALLPGVNEMSPQAYGTFFHRQFAAAVRAAGLPGIGPRDVETTFGDARYGAKGSVRTDVVLRNDVGEVIAIYDVKTGAAGIGRSRAGKLRQKVGVGESVPVIEMNLERGVFRKDALLPVVVSAARKLF